jgi:hypothetical protein
MVKPNRDCGVSGKRELEERELEERELEARELEARELEARDLQRRERLHAKYKREPHV